MVFLLWINHGCSLAVIANQHIWYAELLGIIKIKIIHWLLPGVQVTLKTPPTTKLHLPAYGLSLWSVPLLVAGSRWTMSRLRFMCCSWIFCPCNRLQAYRRDLRAQCQPWNCRLPAGSINSVWGNKNYKVRVASLMWKHVQTISATCKWRLINRNY